MHERTARCVVLEPRLQCRAWNAQVPGCLSSREQGISELVDVRVSSLTTLILSTPSMTRGTDRATTFRLWRGARSRSWAMSMRAA